MNILCSCAPLFKFYQEVEVDLLIRTADCYRETGDLETAVIFYINGIVYFKGRPDMYIGLLCDFFYLVLDEQPENLDVMMSLATIYEEQGKEEEALQLVDFGKKLQTGRFM